MAKICFSVSAIVLFFAPLFGFAADLSFSPTGGTYEVGSRVHIKVLVSGNVSLNAISGVVSVPTSHFSIESVSKNTSMLNFWVTEPSFSKDLGTARFEGVALNGFTGLSGTVVTLVLKPIKVGTVQIAFQTGQILANDGQGTDITGNLKGATYTIIEQKEKPQAPLVPEQESIKETPQIPPTLNAPQISQSSLYGTSVIRGTSDYPHAQVLLTFFTEDGAKIFITGLSNKDGDFTIEVPQSLKKGVYVVTAVIVKEDKTHSDQSNQLILMIGSIFSDMSNEMKGFMFLLLCIIVFLVIRAYLSFRKNRRLKIEILEAENVLHKSFDSLRDSLDVYDKNTGLNHEQVASELKQDIKDTENVIRKEIKDIESV